MKKTLLSLLVLSLAGCANNPYLQPLPNVENARLRVVSIPSNNVFVSEPQRTECISEEWVNPIATLGFKVNLTRSLSRIGMPAQDKKIINAQQNEVYIPAGKDFTMKFSGVGLGSFGPGQSRSEGGINYNFCEKLLTFNAKANTDYEAVYDFVTVPDQGETCVVKLYQIVPQPDQSYQKVLVPDYKVIDQYCPAK